LLVLFEVPTPGYPKIVRNWKKYARHSVTLLRGDPRNQLSAHAQVLKGLLARKTQAVTRRAMVRLGMEDRIARNEIGKVRNIFTGRAYQPHAISCPVIHFLAADEAHSTSVLDDPRLGWSDFARRFSTRSVPGVADGIFRPPHVRHLAREVAAALDAVRIDTRPLP